jgi:hypothetical protein
LEHYHRFFPISIGEEDFYETRKRSVMIPELLEKSGSVILSYTGFTTLCSETVETDAQLELLPDHGAGRGKRKLKCR